MRIHCLYVEQMHSTLLAGTTRYVMYSLCGISFMPCLAVGFIVTVLAAV